MATKSFAEGGGYKQTEYWKMESFPDENGFVNILYNIINNSISEDD